MDIAIAGCGSLASEVLNALSLCNQPELSICLLGRDAERLKWAVQCAAARAVNTDYRIEVQTKVVTWSDISLSEALSELRPKVLLHTASLQSPWTLMHNSEWSRLIREAGYGLTLPLQAALALQMGTNIAKASPRTLFVNACYPDAVNQILKARDLPIVCGIGNVAILSAILRSQLPPNSDRLYVLAHHAHVAAFIRGTPLLTSPVRAWVGPKSIDDLATSILMEAGLPADSRLNSITGGAAVPLLLALCGRRTPWRGHATGPEGKIGGYPVLASTMGVEIELPDTMTVDEAVKINTLAAVYDGVTVEADGWATFSRVAISALESINLREAQIPQRWHASDAEEIANKILRLREALGGS